jgi:hypothetical protein
LIICAGGAAGAAALPFWANPAPQLNNKHNKTARLKNVVMGNPSPGEVN